MKLFDYDDAKPGWKIEDCNYAYQNCLEFPDGLNGCHWENWLVHGPMIHFYIDWLDNFNGYLASMEKYCLY